MKKTVFQLCLAGYLFVLSLFVTLSGVTLLLKPEMQEAFTTHYLLAIWMLVSFFGPTILLLCAAIQIYRTGRWGILKGLLYASIAKFNLMGYLAYEFYFLPYLYFGVKVNQLFSKLSFPILAGFYLPFIYNFELEVNGEPFFLIGINIVSIVIIKLLNKYYRPAT